jgi:hypothetical protein
MNADFLRDGPPENTGFLKERLPMKWSRLARVRLDPEEVCHPRESK